MSNQTHQAKFRTANRQISQFTPAIALLLSLPALAQQTPVFTPGNLVVTVSGNGVVGGSGSFGDNQASPLTLIQYTTSGVYVSSLVLPQTGAGANVPVSAEYGSSSEGTLQLSAPGHYLTVMGYGINAATFNGNHDAYSAGPNAALAQSGSLTGQSYTPIPRVIALIDPYGNVNSSTALFNIFDQNNPRSVYTADGFKFYVSGQGNSPDHTGGVFFTALGSSAATPITGDDTNSKTTSQDTRDVQIFNNTLYVSVDSKEGSGSNRDFIGTLGTPPATSLFNNKGGPTAIKGFGNNGGTGKVTLTAAQTNGVNSAGQEINLSPQNYFFASASVLYVADCGVPKNDSVTNDPPIGSTLGDGGLQKWVNSAADGSGTWSLKYTLAANLNLVPNTSASGTTGLYGLTGKVVGANVQLYATNFTITDLDPTFLYGITDVLAATTPAVGESFTQLATHPPDSNFKGVAFAPTLPSGSATVTSSPSGLAFTSTGAGCAPGTYTTPITLIWTPGSSCALSVVTPQSGGSGVQYTFSQWTSGANSSTDTSFPATASSSATVFNASFTTQYQLTTSAGAGGSVSAGGYFDSGTNATVTATASSGNYFVNFTGTTTSTTNPLTLAMTGPQSIMANFAPQVTPVITWPTPAAIKFGSALSSAQLNATANVPGTFVYTPPAGTVLPAGSGEPLSLMFTPNDQTVYTTATASNSITVNPPSSGPASLVVTTVLTRAAGNVIVQLTIANTGGTAAANVVLTNAKVGSVLAVPLPQAVGTIAAGGTAQVTVTVPGSVGASGAASSLAISGTYTGGTFSSSARITLP